MGLQAAILFVIGLGAPLLFALFAQRWLRDAEGAGWVYMAAITPRILILIVGCTVVYFVWRGSSAFYMKVFALGVVASWLVHFVFALVQLRK